MQLWRLTKTKYSSSAFDGEGARVYGGRWNSPGTRMAYASGSPALAVLEVLVHLEKSGVLPSYSLIRARIPDTLIQELSTTDLPSSWNTSPVPPEVQAIGDQWVRSHESVILRVPSVVIGAESNFLINPAHPDFRHFAIEHVEAFSFDARLIP
ncbi:MAG: RES family NAD+ phosphorylase [Gemmatimonadaceae bacterium]